jgi:uncharacterized SAM-binding protein YcdF (DUF218 family)
VLKSAAESILLPPVSLVYVTALGLLFARFRFGRRLAWTGLIILTILGMPAVAGWLTIALEKDLPLSPPTPAKPAAIVILGGEVTRTLDPPYTLPGKLTLDRLRAGAKLHRETGLPIMVTGGIVQRDRPAVARIMADSLRDDFQTPAEWVEDKSATTWDNATMSAAILRDRGIVSVYVVSQAWHLKRAIIAFNAAGLTVTAAPSSRDTPSGLLSSDFIPTIAAWHQSYYAIHEWIGCAWYSLR